MALMFSQPVQARHHPPFSRSVLGTQWSATPLQPAGMRLEVILLWAATKVQVCCHLLREKNAVVHLKSRFMNLIHVHCWSLFPLNYFLKFRIFSPWYKFKPVSQQKPSWFLLEKDRDFISFLSNLGFTSFISRTIDFYFFSMEKTLSYPKFNTEPEKLS